jgi:hypothetical protein
VRVADHEHGVSGAPFDTAEEHFRVCPDSIKKRNKIIHIFI